MATTKKALQNQNHSRSFAKNTRCWKNQHAMPHPCHLTGLIGTCKAAWSWCSPLSWAKAPTSSHPAAPISLQNRTLDSTPQHLPYKIRTPLQNQDAEPFFKPQQQDQKSPKWTSTKWSSITQTQKFINFRLLFSNQVPDFVEQFRVPAWWSGALSDGLWLKKKGVAP